jgi:hypothetical protein
VNLQLYVELLVQLTIKSLLPEFSESSSLISLYFSMTLIPTGKEPRLISPLGGPHRLFDDSFIIEFLQPAAELDATVLMRATYVGDHPSMQLGKKHPQVSKQHIKNRNLVS